MLKLFSRLKINVHISARQFSAPANELGEKLSLDKFFSTKSDPNYELTDETALKYMKLSAELSLIRFKDEKEMLQYKDDFQAALLFIKKLEEVNVTHLLMT